MRYPYRSTHQSGIIQIPPDKNVHKSRGTYRYVHAWNVPMHRRERLRVDPALSGRREGPRAACKRHAEPGDHRFASRCDGAQVCTEQKSRDICNHTQYRCQYQYKSPTTQIRSHSPISVFQGGYIPLSLYDLQGSIDHVARWESCDLHDLAHVSWVGPVLRRSCRKYHNDRHMI